MFALISCLKGWRHYILGKRVIVYTDHQSLTHFLSQPNLTRRLGRWFMILSEFDVEIIYKPGLKNFVADCLSRRPLQNQDGSINTDYQDLKEKGKVLKFNYFIDNHISQQKITLSSIYHYYHAKNFWPILAEQIGRAHV